ncbi:hypothetical protein NW762_013916 [Fusarium torreyae]|uniref:Uncharacterized protein n=1 Tax=Fusarium torreyae TaxID=1237075 RepID=A0A9W8RN97_9HYPO|nr:hypothetical protein NW762_013916 [Fusarium torreyae]
MPNQRTSSTIPRKLPPCDGPKLDLFPYHKSRIQWLERLDNEDDEVTSNQGYVFRARIRGQEYAIKVFKFFDPLTSDHFWGPLLGEDTPLDTAAYYTDPFYAECRAYGRIRDAANTRALKPDVAIPCHGFLFLQPRDQEALSDRNIDLGQDDIDPDYQRSTIGGLRARAIVKDVASSDSGVHTRSLTKILSRIVSMNRGGIYNMDIRIDNFRDGKLVDFGSSWTEPHACMDNLGRRAVLRSKFADREMFDEMVKEEEIPNPKLVKGVHRMRHRSQIVA